MTQQRSSNDTLHTISMVAQKAGVTRQTLYTWLDSGLIETPRYDVDGKVVFTVLESKEVIREARRRQEAQQRLKLPER